MGIHSQGTPISNISLETEYPNWAVSSFPLAPPDKYRNQSSNYKVVQIWPGQTVTCLHTK
jgi:hypothetical protein